jgi:hypothetical protein
MKLRSGGLLRLTLTRLRFATLSVDGTTLERLHAAS